MSSLQYIELPELPSTNTYAMERTLSHNTIVYALRQSGGKGRKGRSFLSHTGGVYMSIVRAEALPLSSMHRYMMSAGMAVVDVCREYGIDARIKWPNDVLVEGKKLAGILIETRLKESIEYAVIGIGLNVNNYLDDIDIPATSLGLLTGQKQDIAQVVRQMATRFDYWMQSPALYTRYREQLLTIGKLVETEEGYTGRVQDVLEDGRLLLDTQGTTHIIGYGDVTIKEKLC